MSTYRIPVIFAGMACMLAITGCSSLGELAPASPQTITLHTDPSQASVLADGAEIGVTPLTFNPADAFKAGFTGGGGSLLSYRYVGKLIVKKPGCTDYIAEVDDNLLSKDINVKLVCDPDYQPPSAPAAEIVPDIRPHVPASAGERLQRIDALHDKGLISDAEHSELRRRVLDTL